MDICLVTAPTAAEFRESAELSSESVRRVALDPQLGILSLAAVLETLDVTFKIVNLNRAYLEYAEQDGLSSSSDFAEVAASLIGLNDARIYGFASICSSYPLTIRIAERLKSMRPNSLTLLGGPQASVVDIETLTAFPFVDLVLRGEAEYSLPILLEHVASGVGFDGVPGLSYRRQGRLQRNSNAPIIQNLDELPSPAYHLTNDLSDAKRAALELGRGCPFACTFCSTNDFFRRKFRLRSPARVLADMQALSAKYAITDFELVHDMFTVDRQRVIQFCEAMIASGDGFTWSCSARTDCVDEEILELMARSGCRGVFFGVESGSKKIQRIIDKDLDPGRAREMIDVAERVGIDTTVSLITGFPEETVDDLRETMRVFMCSARCPGSSPQLNLLAPLAATPIHSQHKDELVLEELCSDVSHQGRRQDASDLKLIREHSEVFPNFYLIPCIHLNHGFLLELREFLLAGDSGLRWLFVAIDQDTSQFLDFFSDWRKHRLGLRSTLDGLELRHYYRTDEFCMDLFSFLRIHRAGKDAAVEALLECEDALRKARVEMTPPRLDGARISIGETLRSSDVPMRKRGTTVIELDCNIQELINTLKRRDESAWMRGQHFYVNHATSTGTTRLIQISDWMAWALKVCDGNYTIQEILERRFPNSISSMPEDLQEFIYLRLIAKAHAEGFIEIYRTASEAAANQEGDPTICKYREIRADASLQNHRSIHAQ